MKNNDLYFKMCYWFFSGIIYGDYTMSPAKEKNNSKGTMLIGTQKCLMERAEIHGN